MNIFQHWDGLMPEFIAFARWTVGRHHANVKTLTKKDMPPGHTRLEKAPPQYKADLYRVGLLHREGGLWLDSDYIAFGHVRSVVHFEDDCDAWVFADTYKGKGEYENDFLAIKRNTDWSQELLDRVWNRLDDPAPLEWGDLGRRTLNKMMADPRFSSRARIVLPDEVSLYRGMTNAWDMESPHRFMPLPAGCVGVQLCHSLCGEYLRYRSIAEWRETKTVIGSVIRLAERRIGAKWQGETR